MLRKPGTLRCVLRRYALRFAMTALLAVGVVAKVGYACAASIEDACLTPANDPSPAPFGALAPNAAQRAVIALAQRTRLKRGAFRPMLSRLLNLLRAGPVDVPYQGAAFRFYHLTSATERGALLNPDYNIEELDFLRAHTPTGGVFVDVGANAGTYALPLAHHVGPQRTGDRGRAASGDGRAARIQSGRIGKRQCGADRRRRRRCRRRTDDRNRPRKLRRQPCLSRRQRAQRRDPGAGDAAVAHPAGPQGRRRSIRSRSTSKATRIAC